MNSSLEAVIIGAGPGGLCLAHGLVATMTSFEARSAERIAPWKTAAVTLLADAMHNVTPFRGMRVNMALRESCERAYACSSEGRAQVRTLQIDEQSFLRRSQAARSTCPRGPRGPRISLRIQSEISC
jgi:2-polyprenyl-6-methoxyphenol hydroxylase-like FAD-dependent oxidoreductase